MNPPKRRISDCIETEGVINCEAIIDVINERLNNIESSINELKIQANESLAYRYKIIGYITAITFFITIVAGFGIDFCQK